MKDASLAITVLSLMTACLPVGPPVPQRDTPTPVAPSPLIAATPARSSRQLPALDVPGTIVLFTSSTSFAIYRGGAVAEVRAPHEVRSARLAPDGAFLAAVLWVAGDQATYVWRYDLKSREQTTRKSNLPLAKHGVQWSPDARLFALVEERSLWIGDLEGRTQREAVPPYYWEKDLPPGKRLYATAWRLSDEVTVLAGDGGLPTSELALWRWRWGKSPEFDAVPLTLQSLPVVSWSPDGSALAYNSLDSDGRTHVVRVRRGASDEIVLRASDVRDPADPSSSAEVMDIFDLEWDAKGSSLGIVGRAYVGWGYFTAIWTAGAVANVFVTPRDCYARTIAWGLSDLTLSCSAAAAGVGARLFVFDRSVKPRATLPIGAKAEHFSAEGLDWVVVSSRSGDLLLVPLANVDRHVSVRLSFVGWCCPAR